jgi:hypothetical protein
MSSQYQYQASQRSQYVYQTVGVPPLVPGVERVRVMPTVG